VTCILNTQQDKDMVYWQVDSETIQARCAQRGVVWEQQPFPDFDAEGLRRGLPKAVAVLDVLLRANHRVYLHCTAGLGRSPGVAIAYQYWVGSEYDLQSAYDSLTGIRPCGPNMDAIRGATADVLYRLGADTDTGMLSHQLQELPSLDEGEGMFLSQEEHDVIQTKLRTSAWAQAAESKYLFSPNGAAGAAKVARNPSEVSIDSGSGRSRTPSRRFTSFTGAMLATSLFAFVLVLLRLYYAG